MASAKRLKKLTTKDIMGLNTKPTHEVKAELIKIAESDNSRLYHMKGEVTAYGGKHTQYGESFFFVGSFAAQNLQTGEIFSAGKVYLPKDVTEDLIAAFKSRSDDSAISFDLVVGVIPDAKQGYNYVSEPVRSPEAVDREAEMIASFKPLQIAGPKKK